MRGLLVATLLVALVPVAQADPLVDDVWYCPVDVPDPVVRACVITWDEPQVICLDTQVGVRQLDPCLDNPDFPPSLPSLPMPAAAFPNVTCVVYDVDTFVSICFYVYGGSPDEGCIEIEAPETYRQQCWTV